MDLALGIHDRSTVLDADRDGRPERVALEGAGAETLLSTTPTTGTAPSSILFALKGVKDNRRGKGAIVELVYGPVYRRLYWSGEPTLIGTHGAATVDVLRVSWPNGVVQSAIHAPAEGHLVMSPARGA